MLRILLTILLPVALPLLLYLFYVKMVRPRPAPGQAGGTAVAARGNPLALWLVLGAAALLIALMATLWFARGVPPGTKLIAPHMEDGEIVPSRRQDRAP